MGVGADQSKRTASAARNQSSFWQAFLLRSLLCVEVGRELFVRMTLMWHWLSEGSLFDDPAVRMSVIIVSVSDITGS